MPLDVLGRTRATLITAASNSPWPEGLGNLLKCYRAGDSPLQLLDFNEEFLVSVSHQLALITSLPLITYYNLYFIRRWLNKVGYDCRLESNQGIA